MKEKVVVIGGTSGMGLAAASKLAKNGYSVVISGRTEGSIESALKKIQGEAVGYPLNFSNSASVEQFFTKVDKHDHLALVGSGQAAWGSFSELTVEALRSAFDEKFYGFFLCAQASLKKLRKDGSILFTVGGACRSAIPGTSGVAAVNGAIQSMAFTMAKEIAPVRVNILSPGLVDTPMYNWMTQEEKEGFFKKMGGNLPVGRVGNPDEIAQAVLFLIQNKYATGAIIDIDGGGRLH